MICYATVGTNDFAAAKIFYDKILAPLNARHAMANERFQSYTNDAGAMLAILEPYDGKPATAGNGTMIVLEAPSREVVDAVYTLAIANGGSDEGAPGVRLDPFYGCYFRDLDGNKISVYHWGKPPV